MTQADVVYAYREPNMRSKCLPGILLFLYSWELLIIHWNDLMRKRSPTVPPLGATLHQYFFSGVFDHQYLSIESQQATVHYCCTRMESGSMWQTANGKRTLPGWHEKNNKQSDRTATYHNKVRMTVCCYGDALLFTKHGRKSIK